MGNDGGSIPTRRELVKEAARNLTATELKDKQKEHLAHRWANCAVSHTRLQKPVVSDYTGNLYNKDAIIQFLLPDDVSTADKADYDKVIQGRIKSLKDVVEVLFEERPDDAGGAATWVCPVTAKELGPNVKAVYLVPCGHAFSHEAVHETKGDGKCVQCATPYDDRDVVPILPSTEKDQAAARERIEALRSLGLTHALKKSGGKKRKANGDPNSDHVVNGSNKPGHVANGAAHETPSPGPRSSTPRSGPTTAKPHPSSNGIKNAATASLAARVLEEEETRKRARRENDTIASLYAKKSDDKGRRDGDFMTRGFSIPANARHQ